MEADKRMHLIVDGYAHNTALMTDKKLMREWLIQTVKKAGMAPFGEPICRDFQEKRVIVHIVSSFEMWHYKWLLLDRGINSRTGGIIMANLKCQEEIMGG